MDMELDGRVAVVTGGAQGIGLATCRALGREGATVVVADVNEAQAETAASALTASGLRAVAAAVDIADEASVAEFYETVTQEVGEVDILVNNAGVCRMIPILEITVEEWDWIVGVNLRGTFLMSKEAFRRMIPRKQGKIISLASAAAKIGGLAAGAHYSASKAGVICFTKSLALQAAPHKINVNAVCPGPMKTEMTDAWGEDTNTAFAAKIPWKAYGEPEDVAEAVVFLASGRSRYITGEVIDVNGGFVMD